jgi:hypothetical protein
MTHSCNPSYAVGRGWSTEVQAWLQANQEALTENQTKKQKDLGHGSNSRVLA